MYNIDDAVARTSAYFIHITAEIGHCNHGYQVKLVYSLFYFENCVVCKLCFHYERSFPATQPSRVSIILLILS